MNTQVIKNKTQHEKYLSELERLIALDPVAGTPEADRFDLLATLVEKYEKENFPFDWPDPIEAIQFCMEEQTLRQKDLIPFIGSRSKVSEVLSKKRPLSLPMIRALNKGLGIPVDILIQEAETSEEGAEEVDWEKFPLREMNKRGWIEADNQEIRENASKLMHRFMSPLEGKIPVSTLFKRSLHERASRSMDKYALRAWTVRILIRVKKEGPKKEYIAGTVTEKFMREVAQLSWSNSGPLLAQEFLANHGIALIIERHLPKTHLDGASMLAMNGRPVIGMTIRHNRLDNFWFTLMHELAHVCLHLKDTNVIYYDDLDIEKNDDPEEKEADFLASETLIPRGGWKSSRACQQKTLNAISDYASKLGIHPAIVAGRIRHETKNFKILNQVVGHGKVEVLFPSLDGIK